ncbi:MAG: class I SAM-dependent methyltransferase [Pseudomonadota bacterium]
MALGQSFEDTEVAEHYGYRPDYPADLFAKLYELSPQHHHALDLGCGPGKVARQICTVFDSVTAVDASEAMLTIAQNLQSNSEETDRTNIRWVHSPAETADFADHNFDLIVAAASIHWMDHTRLFPRLLAHVAGDYVFAVVDGDGAHHPPWQSEWGDFLGKWIFELTGQTYAPDNTDSAFAKKMKRHKDWLRLEGEASFEHTCTQTIDDFIRCQFSRDTFAPSKLGNRRGEFSEQLRRVVSPHADPMDVLTYRVLTRVEWGKIRTV